MQIYGIFSEYVAFPLVFGQIMAFLAVRRSKERLFCLLLGIKKGIPLYPNLVNLKSNTMKNTMQSYGHFSEKQEKDAINCPLSCIFNFLLSFCNIDFAFSRFLEERFRLFLVLENY